MPVADEPFLPPITDERKRFMLRVLPTAGPCKEAGEIKQLIKEGLIRLNKDGRADLTDTGRKFLQRL
jgi:hypothetical protein